METTGEEKHIIWEETYTILIIINSRRKIESNLQQYDWRKSPALREPVEREGKYLEDVKGIEEEINQVKVVWTTLLEYKN